MTEPQIACPYCGWRRDPPRMGLRLEAGVYEIAWEHLVASHAKEARALKEKPTLDRKAELMEWLIP